MALITEENGADHLGHLQRSLIIQKLITVDQKLDIIIHTLNASHGWNKPPKISLLRTILNSFSASDVYSILKSLLALGILVYLLKGGDAEKLLLALSKLG